MDELRLGDRVRVALDHAGTGVGARERFEPIIFFSHRAPHAPARFVELSTRAGHRLVLTRGHLLFVNGAALVAAEHVHVGDVLQVAGDKSEAAVVARVRSVSARGLFNPHTPSGRLVADGILVSAYTTALPHQLAHALLAPLRALFLLFTLVPASPLGLLPSFAQLSVYTMGS